MHVKYIDHMGSDLSVVNAARVSFNKRSESLTEQDKRLIQYLADHNHWTPFSHTSITLLMKAPIPIRTQCFKHKVGFTENEVSRRYVDNEPEFFMPEWRKRAKSNKQGSLDELVTGSAYLTVEYSKLLLAATDFYNLAIEAGVAPELARFALPQSMYTEWWWTGSLPAYARFCNLRLEQHAQREVKELATMVSEIIEPLFPVSWKVLCVS